VSERLALEQPDGARTELSLEGTLLLGSDPRRVGLLVTGTGVADVHCAIGRARGGGWAVKDLGSLAGTQLNGQRVSAARLAPGDELRLGAAALRVVEPGASAGSSRSDAAPDARRRPGPDETQALTGSDLAPELASLTAAAEPGPPAIRGYKIERRLGRGGMGEVYLAVQERLQRTVALKLLPPKLAANADFVRRFEAEARAAAALQHPNVVTIYDVGEDNGAHYLSMEYMDGGTLEERVRVRGRLDAGEVLAILRDAARGLQYAEQRGIVHRDLKPANLMQDHLGQTKIADLGLATHVEAEQLDAAGGKVFGTPHFISPEQARGERADHRSDLYSLGATAYRLLSGRTPHAGDDAREIVRALLRDEPRPLAEVAPEVPSEVAALVAKLMAKEPGQRFASAGELLARVEELGARDAGGARARARPGGALLPLGLLALAAAIAWWWVENRGGAGRDGFPPRGPSTAQVPGEPGRSAGPDGSGAPTAPGAATPGGAQPAGPGGNGKGDSELQLFEANARVALLELTGREMQPGERRDELRLLAGRFRGTSAATEALAKADEISAWMDSKAAADAERKTRTDALLLELAAVARPDQQPPEPGRALLAMRTLPVPPELAEDPVFVRGRKDLESRILALAAHHAEQELGHANRELEAGDFDAARARLARLLPIFELPEFPLGGAPSGIDAFFETGRKTRERYHNLEQLQHLFERQRAREDQLAIASGLGGPAGFERELAELQLGAARARLEHLAGELRGQAEQAWARELARELAAGEAVLATLAREFQGWRRRAVNDPRERRGTLRTALGADAEGLLLESESGVERIPWSAWGANPRELARLFAERLTREWKGEEQAGIAALLRLAAVVESARETSKMFDASRRSNFTEGNARDLLASFEPAAEWAGQAGPESQERLARERAAAELLCEGLRAMTESRWPAASEALERLLRQHAGALLVQLHSDGRTLEEILGG
jgi:hypothetical protein